MESNHTHLILNFYCFGAAERAFAKSLSAIKNSASELSSPGFKPLVFVSEEVALRLQAERLEQVLELLQLLELLQV